MSPSPEQVKEARLPNMAAEAFCGSVKAEFHREAQPLIGLVFTQDANGYTLVHPVVNVANSQGDPPNIDCILIGRDFAEIFPLENTGESYRNYRFKFNNGRVIDEEYPEIIAEGIFHQFEYPQKGLLKKPDKSRIRLKSGQRFFVTLDTIREMGNQARPEFMKLFLEHTVNALEGAAGNWKYYLDERWCLKKIESRE
jgi:hypothetical protein